VPVPQPNDKTTLVTWYRENAPELFEIVQLLDMHETWTTNDQEILSRIDAGLNQVAPGCVRGILIDDVEFPTIVLVLAYIRASKALQMMSQISKVQPGFAGDLLSFCESVRGAIHPTPETQVVLSRFELVAKAQVYIRLFGPERRAEIIRIVKTMQEES
jgi:hypothetical protein